jgi:hypothetical protein
VQLVAGQLDRDHVVRLGVHHGFQQRQPDVACGNCPVAGRGQDRGQHLHRGGLAVGAGDAQPGRRVGGIAQPPGQLDLAPDRDAPLDGGREQRRVRRDAR